MRVVDVKSAKELVFALIACALLLLAGCAQAPSQAANETQQPANESQQFANNAFTAQKIAALPEELPDIYRANETSVDLGTDVLKNPFPEKPALKSARNAS